MSALTLVQALAKTTRAAIYAKGLEVAEGVGLPVSSWEPGDTTRSMYHYLAEILETLEGIVVNYIGAGFLDWAEQQAEESGDSSWLEQLAEQVYGVESVKATYATTSVTLTNTGGGLYELGTSGDVTFKNTTTGKTYRNTSGGTLLPGPGTTLTVDVVANEAGSDSSALADEIDELVTNLLGVTVSNATAAIGQDAERPRAIADRCRAKLGVLSPNGPRDAYVYVATTPSLSGTTAVTKAVSPYDSDTGDVTVYVAGPSGAVGAADVDLVKAAILATCTPLCITPAVASAAALTIPVTYQLWLYTSVGVDADAVEDAVADALGQMFAVRPIGGDVIGSEVGRIYHSMIESTIRGVFRADAFRVVLTSPAADTDLTAGQTATLGAVTATVTFVERR